MQPNRNIFNSAITIAYNEVHEDDLQNEDPEVYENIERTRHLWNQVLSIFRLYLANRVGSFDESSLPVQEKSIETMYGELRDKLDRLSAMDRDERLGFELVFVFVLVAAL